MLDRVWLPLLVGHELSYFEIFLETLPFFLWFKWFKMFMQMYMSFVQWLCCSSGVYIMVRWLHYYYNNIRWMYYFIRCVWTIDEMVIGVMWFWCWVRPYMLVRVGSILRKVFFCVEKDMHGMMSSTLELWCNTTPQGHWIEDSKKIGPEMQEKALGFSWALG